MGIENLNFTTTSGSPLHNALGFRKGPKGGFFPRQRNQKVGILEQGTHYGHFSVSHNFIDKITDVSRNDGKKPDECEIGRECYSFSERENRAFIIAIREAETLVQKINSLGGGKCSINIEVDAIGNLFFRVKGEREAQGIGFETHMLGSHLDSVENGGKYDGVAGIAAGLETLQQVLFHQTQGTLLNSFCLAIFRSEESSPNNGVACLGSSIATGTIDREKLENIVYTKENGKDVLLKEHLESSLRKYFQSLQDGNDKRGDWGTGVEYIDHEWWYWFCQKHCITEANFTDGDWWEKIIELLKNPTINRDTTHSYHELHIEQGSIIATSGVDLGIVSGGIGGVKRYKTLQPVLVETQEVSAKEYEIYSFDIFGKADHTGSTPNNPELESFLYRRDAQIAANLFLRVFLEYDFGELVLSGAQNNEGYTKVPFCQSVTLAIRRDRRQEFQAFFESKSKEFLETSGVVLSSLGYIQSFGNISCISHDSAKRSITSLLGVSETASREFERQKGENPQEKEFGTTRATLTNVTLNTEGLQFQLDVREVDSDDVDILLQGVSKALEIIIPDGVNGLQKVSEKSHEKVDETLRDTAAEIAKILGYTTIFLPSMPGHDGDRIASAGIPISMIFVRQANGVSHNPAEKMTREDYNNACELLMKSRLAKLV